MDEDLGKEKGSERQTNVVVRTNCPCVMVAKEEKGIWKINRLDLDHNHEHALVRETSSLVDTSI